MFPTELQKQEESLCLLAELPVRRCLFEMLFKSLEDRDTLSLQEQAVRYPLLCGCLTRVLKALPFCDEMI